MGELKIAVTVHHRNDLYCVGWGVKLYSLTHSSYWSRLRKVFVQKTTTTNDSDFQKFLKQKWKWAFVFKQKKLWTKRNS